MKPPAFAYHRPDTVDEAVGLLSELGPDASVLAGGQSLIPMLNMRLAAPRHVVDINRVAGFQGISVTDGRVEVGALVRQRQLETDDGAARDCALLRQALVHVAHRPIRSRGTVVGSLAHADPAAELPAVLALLDGSVIAAGPNGEREIPAAEFFRGWFQTALEPGELAVAARFRRLGPGEGSAFVEVARRSGDFALCAAAAVVSAGSARVALGGVGQRPSVHDVSELLHGEGEGALDELRSRIDPSPDIHASAEFRRHLATELTRRAVAAARRDGDAAEGGA